MCKHPANERRRYIVTSSLIGWAHAWKFSLIIATVVGSLATQWGRAVAVTMRINLIIQAWYDLSGQHHIQEIYYEVMVYYILSIATTKKDTYRYIPPV